MSDVIEKKERNTHDRIRKRILLVITADSSVMARDVIARLNVDQGSATVLLLCTSLRGRELEKAVKRYMRDNMIRLSLKDEVIYWDRIRVGGDADDCDPSG